MSWADRLRDEGWQGGKQQGWREERERSRVVLARTVENMVKLRFGPPPDWALSKLHAADLPTLERWSEDLLTTPSLEALLNEGPSSAKP